MLRRGGTPKNARFFWVPPLLNTITHNYIANWPIHDFGNGVTYDDAYSCEPDTLQSS